MKKIILMTSICLTAFSARASEIRPYAELKMSENFAKIEYSEPGFNEDLKDSAVLGGSIAAGLQFSPFRLEVEGFINDKMEDEFLSVIPAEVESKGLFLNAYIDIPLAYTPNIKPYIGAGIGYSWLKGTIDETAFGIGKYSTDDNDIAWNVGLGVAFSVTNNIDLSLGYRYENLGEIEEYSTNAEVTNHKVSLGFRYTF